MTPDPELERDRERYIREGGYFKVTVGTLNFNLGKDPSETEKVTYSLHYSSVTIAQLLGLDAHKYWRTVATFRREAARALRAWCRVNLKIIEKEDIL